MLLIGIIVGVFIGLKTKSAIEKISNFIEFKLFGFTVILKKSEESPTVEKADPKIRKVVNITDRADKNKCELCNDEDMFIAGTKNLIPCPKCKRNANKFNEKTKALFS